MRRGGAVADQRGDENVPSLSPQRHADGKAAAEPCARGHSFGTSARCDPRAERRASAAQRIYRGLAAVALSGLTTNLHPTPRIYHTPRILNPTQDHEV